MVFPVEGEASVRGSGLCNRQRQGKSTCGGGRVGLFSFFSFSATSSSCGSASLDKQKPEMQQKRRLQRQIQCDPSGETDTGASERRKPRRRHAISDLPSLSVITAIRLQSPA